MSKPLLRTAYDQIEPFTTLDASEVRELMHPGLHGACSMSLAEATIKPYGTTKRHRHVRAEEIYHIVAGTGRMHVGDEAFDVQPGDTVCIPPQAPHFIENRGDTSLRILCCCTPAYSHDDTELL